MEVARGTISLAAEFAVASELCRRDVYAQLTLGNLKRTDILAFSTGGKLIRIEVKAKQGPEWPNCRGIHGKGVFLVFVDFRKKAPSDRPDFYILSASDWLRLLRTRVTELQARNPELKIEIDDLNTAVFPDQITRSGRPYRGMGIRPSHVQPYRDRWQTLLRATAGRVSEGDRGHRP